MELPDTMTIEEADLLTRRVQRKVFRETGVILTGIGVYSYNTTNEEAAEIRNNVQKTVLSHDWASPAAWLLRRYGKENHALRCRYQF